MKANELRIGNFVKYLTLNGNSEILANGIYLFELGELKLHEIPLTEEWLLKFGFKKCLFFTKDVYTHENNTAHTSYRIDGYDCNIFLKDLINSLERQIMRNDIVGGHGFNVHAEFKENNCHIATIYYVHQLQNLYFALQGEELIYNES